MAHDKILKRLQDFKNCKFTKKRKTEEEQRAFVISYLKSKIEKRNWHVLSKSLDRRHCIVKLTEFEITDVI